MLFDDYLSVPPPPPYTQCSYQAGVFDLTKCVAELLWDQFVLPLTDHENEQLLLQYKYVN